MKHLPLSGLLLPLLLTACASGPKLEEREIGTIPNLHGYGDILLAGQPSADDLELARRRGVRTVVNIRHPSETEGFDEEQFVTMMGLEYVAFPWAGPDQLTDDVFDRARELFETAEKPMMLHCGSANRVGAVWIPWRVLDGGLTYEQALAEAKTIGLRTEAYETKAADYIERNSN